MPDVVTYKSIAEVRRIVAMLPALASGARGSDPRLARVLLVRVGLTALYHIKAAFIQKTNGGTDASGLRWDPLSPYTIAYRVRRRSRQRRPQDRPSQVLSATQRDRWWTIYRQQYARRLRDGTPNPKGQAARFAWGVLRAEGVQTLKSQFGNQKVQILRDTGALLTSLSPVDDPNAAAGNVTPVAKQVFRVGRGEVIVGTNRRWAWTHHRGTPNRRPPQRRLWPEPGQWPALWWEDMLSQARAGLIDVATVLLA